MHFASPYYLWLLSALVPMIAYYVWRTLQGGASIQISSVEGVVRAPKTVRYWLRHLPFAQRLAALALLIVALARPQDVERLSRTNTEGIDIMLAIDVSGSMLARDFRPDRITAAKEVAGSFIADRYGDRIGLVAFAGEAFTQSPLTTDQGTLQTLLARIRSGLIEDGTAIGNGLATAINRLRESEAKSKVIILLTDGVNNRGEIAPQTAAEIAKAQGIRVYTIGVGTEGMAPYPAVDIYGTPTGGTVMAKVEIDEKTLRSIAEQTMQQAAADSLRADTERAEAFYNLGNAQFKQQKYQEALESYKQSLRLNPSDMEAKYNYAYTKRLLDENKDGGGGGGDQNKDQNQDQNKDQNQNDQSQQNPDQKGDQKDQKGDPKDQQGDQKQNPQEGKGDKEDQGDQQGQPTPSGISPQEQQQMLDAIQAQEDKTQEKLKEKQGVVVRGKKNW